MSQGVHLVGIEVESHLHAHGEFPEERLVVGGVEQQVVGGQPLVALRAAAVGRAAPSIYLPQQQAQAVVVPEGLAVPCGEGGMVHVFLGEGAYHGQVAFCVGAAVVAVHIPVVQRPHQTLCLVYRPLVVEHCRRRERLAVSVLCGCRRLVNGGGVFHPAYAVGVGRLRPRQRGLRHEHVALAAPCAPQQPRVAVVPRLVDERGI